MAQAAIPNTRSTFVAQLLGPLTTPAGNRQFLGELRREIADGWSIALHRVHAARAYREYCAHTRLATETEQQRPMTDLAAEAQAQLDMVSAINRLMLVPAPTIAALRQKQKLRDVSGGRDRWEAAIAADVARLEAKNG